MSLFEPFCLNIDLHELSLTPNRLGLERGKTAEDALTVICDLLSKYGQGGPCCEENREAYYFNSFIIADGKEAWVLETSDKHWVAEKITGTSHSSWCLLSLKEKGAKGNKRQMLTSGQHALSAGVRNISNQLSIGSKIDKMSAGLQDYAKEKGYWSGEGTFDFASCFSAPMSRSQKKLVLTETRKANFVQVRHVLNYCNYCIASMSALAVHFFSQVRNLTQPKLQRKGTNVARNCWRNFRQEVSPSFAA